MVTIARENAAARAGWSPGAPSTVGGAYGLRLDGVGESALLTGVDVDAPILQITTEVGSRDDRTPMVTEDHAEAGLVEGGWLSVNRTGTAHFILPRPVSNEEIIHPWLVPAAGAMNAWLGRQVAHGGAFAIDGAAVAVIGDKEDGKSTLLGWVARADDVEILTDDLLVVDEGRILAGPRCIDLRPGSHAVMEGEHEGQVVRGGTRSRLMLPPCRPWAALAAIVELAWGSEERVTMTRLNMDEALPALLAHTQRVEEGARLLDLLSVPVWRLSRPRSWESLPEVEYHLRSAIL